MNATLGANTTYTYTIIDDDPLPNVSFTDAPFSHEENGVQNVTVALNAPSGKDVSVNYATSDRTAITGIDYTAVSGTLTWMASETGHGSFDVTILGDTLDEGDETINLTLLSAVNCTITGDNPTILTIIDGGTSIIENAVRSHDRSYSPGTPFTVHISIAYQNILDALGIEESIPSGWTFDSLCGDDQPQTSHVGVNGTLEFLWITPPPSPVDFCYVLQVPTNEVGDKNISGEILYRHGGGAEQRVEIQPVPDTILECTYHTADYYSTDWSINLSEILRVIQIYNIDSYHCDSAGEDGYNPGLGEHNCSPHDSDFNPANWVINLSELLRLIQFYNIGCYHCDAAGEDGYNPGCTEFITLTKKSSLDDADSLYAVHSAGNYKPGSDLAIANQITYDGNLTALGLVAELPDGWTFVSVEGTNTPDHYVFSGVTGTLEFVWVTPPASPIEFSYIVQVPEGETGDKSITARILHRFGMGGEVIESAQPDPITLTPQAMRYLYEGMNLFSYPYEIPDGLTTDQLPNHLGVADHMQEISRWNFDTQSFETTSFASETITGTVFPIISAEGYIITMNATQSITLSGSPATSPPIDLNKGMNLVGFINPSEDLTAHTLLTTLGNEDEISSIQAFDPVSDCFLNVHYQDGQPEGPDFQINPGDAYFIYMKAD